MFPRVIWKGDNYYALHEWKFGDPIIWCIRFELDGRSCLDYFPVNTISANTEADARAKMLIYLIENKIIKGEK